MARTTNTRQKWLKFFGYGEQERVPCEMLCGRPCHEVHHIEKRSAFGSKLREEQDDIENLMGLCDFHHRLDRTGELTVEAQKRAHARFIRMKRPDYKVTKLCAYIP